MVAISFDSFRIESCPFQIIAVAVLGVVDDVIELVMNRVTRKTIAPSLFEIDHVEIDGPSFPIRHP